MNFDKAIDGADKLMNTVGNQIDQNTESKQDRRHRLDLTSPFKLPHLIRPLILAGTFILFAMSVIWAFAIATILISKVGIAETGDQMLSTDSIILYLLGATGTAFAAPCGFYYNSRKNEKINANKAKAAIEIEEIKLKQQIKTDRIEARRDRRDKRKDK